MGPRSEERGNGTSGRTPPPQWPLQWGRARKNAETVRQAGHHRHNGRFNGAALGRTRKLDDMICRGCGHIALQWGRARKNAETDREKGGDMSRHLASMGPRSEERGNARDEKGVRTILSSCLIYSYSVFTGGFSTIETLFHSKKAHNVLLVNDIK